MWRGRAEDEVNIAFARALSRAMQRPGKEFVADRFLQGVS